MTGQITHRLITHADEAMLASWNIAHGLAPLRAEMWPKHGFLIANENGPLVAGFVYETDSPIAWLENVVSKPDSAKMERRQAVDMLVLAVKEHCRLRGFNLVFCLSKHPRLIEALGQHGIAQIDKDVCILIGRS